MFGGKSDMFSIDLTTDGRAVVRAHAGLEIDASLRWEGDTLVFDSRLKREGEPATSVVRYSLSADGQTFVAEEQLRSRE